MEYYIYITNACNLNCSYCSVMIDCDNAKIPVEMNYSCYDLKQFIVKNQADFNDNIADIYFFGGEPTLNYSLIEAIMTEMRSVEKMIIKYILHTNGLLIPYAPSLILNNLDLIIISIDYEKIFTEGKINSYFENIIQSVQSIRMHDKKIPLIGRLTVSPLTNIYSECSILGNFFDYVYWQLDNSQIISNVENYKINYIKEINLLFQYWMAFFREGIFLNYVPFISAIGRMINNTPTPTDFYCGYGSSMIYIQTNGNCYACCDSVETSSHIIGDIFNGIKFNDFGIKDTICNDCIYIKICGGRCGRMHKEFESNRINDFCELNKAMFKLIEHNLSEIHEVIDKYPHFIDKIYNPMLNYTEFTA